MKQRTQLARLLKMFRAAGAHGLTAADVASSPPDGGAPILRFGSRVHELRREGHNVVRAGRLRNRCQVFRLLEGAAPAPPPPAQPAPDPALFERTVGAETPRNAILGTDS